MSRCAQPASADDGVLLQAVVTGGDLAARELEDALRALLSSALSSVGRPHR